MLVPVDFSRFLVFLQQLVQPEVTLSAAHSFKLCCRIPLSHSAWKIDGRREREWLSNVIGWKEEKLFSLRLKLRMNVSNCGSVSAP